MSSCSASTAGTPAAVAWCFTGFLNSPWPTLPCAMSTSLPPSGPGPCHPCRRERADTRPVSSGLQQTGRGGLPLRLPPVKWIAQTDDIVVPGVFQLHAANGRAALEYLRVGVYVHRVASRGVGVLEGGIHDFVRRIVDLPALDIAVVKAGVGVARVGFGADEVDAFSVVAPVLEIAGHIACLL